MKWRCTVCNYIYEGDNPPEECPICGVGPEKFVPVEEVAAPSEISEYDRLQSLLFDCSYGLYVITTKADEKLNGMASNSFVQITSEPLRGSVCINKGTKTCEMILKSNVFGVNILGKNNHDLVAHFGFQSGHKVDKFADIPYAAGAATGCPALPAALTFMEFAVEATVDLGTHIMFIGKLLGGKKLGQGEPMTYAYYRATR